MDIFDIFLKRHEKHHTHHSYLSLMKGVIGLMLDPKHTESVFDIEDGLRHSASSKELLRFTAKDSVVQTLIKERYLQKTPPNTPELKKLPKGSLGREYVNHLDQFGFDPDYYRKIDVQEDIDYIMMRIRQTHDIWHVITGFDTHPLGEIAIKAVELAQTHRPMAAAICAGGVFRYMLKQPEEFGYCLDSITAGYHLGLKAKPLLAMKWEELWEYQVEDLRRELNVQVLGPRGGALTVEFSPQSRLVAERAAQQEINKSLFSAITMGEIS
ncbi:Coq4 family protein [Coleofasciculus sp.]|uniref:Coq4 family protein n=1 Tax=Coleofasciculus sp. TaxID=3100458 RepID=UPI003A40A6FA